MRLNASTGIISVIFYTVIISYISYRMNSGPTKRFTILYLTMFSLSPILAAFNLNNFIDSIYGNFSFSISIIFTLWGLTFAYFSVANAKGESQKSKYTSLMSLFVSVIFLLTFSTAVKDVSLEDYRYMYHNNQAFIGLLILTLYILYLVMRMHIDNLRLFQIESNPILISRFINMLTGTTLGAFTCLISFSGFTTTYLLDGGAGWMAIIDPIFISSIILIFLNFLAFFLPNKTHHYLGTHFKKRIFNRRVKNLRYISNVLSNYYKPYVHAKSDDIDYEYHRLFVHILDGIDSLQNQHDPNIQPLKKCLSPLLDMNYEDQVIYLNTLNISHISIGSA